MSRSLKGFQTWCSLSRVEEQRQPIKCWPEILVSTLSSCGLRNNSLKWLTLLHVLLHVCQIEELWKWNLH